MHINLHWLQLGAPVMIDGGFRRGTDVMKALALGAHFGFIGQPFVYAAAVMGMQGVMKAAEIIRSELQRNMALLDVTSIDAISWDILRRQNG